MFSLYAQAAQGANGMDRENRTDTGATERKATCYVYVPTSNRGDSICISFSISFFKTCRGTHFDLIPRFSARFLV
jgi:hypothetical protein